ncbi:hypothetical protein DFA_07343 [Cavenderia fasciculata]|uniref:Macro domain-containing protein n=1 Tax=Cavenderia fasciculata TaxID=261658 RepID=F4PW58_CACFS|nr:uncharacterized protein DFA_07343 [Cavenderia fasciculata]EGG20222.1 hypothetical protein DFA_07343 [Cavenderia fasciculata]|eukprot:XP_004367205.1 hypothetical protein DFA_07343 [Cavenderia fasciculata]
MSQQTLVESIEEEIKQDNDVLEYYIFQDGRSIIVKSGNIVKQSVDAIVNPANSHLAHGGGAAGAISMAAGRKYDEDGFAYLKKNGGEIKPGNAMIMSNYNIRNIKAIVNAVGPIVHRKLDQEHIDALTGAVQSSLNLVNNYHDKQGDSLQSIAIPAISAGIFGYPKDECAKTIIATCTNYFITNPQTNLKRIILIDMNLEMLDYFQEHLISFKNHQQQ